MTKSSASITLDSALMKKLATRAKKESLTTSELCSDIIRRSMLSYKGSSSTDNVDDKFLTFFSRKTKKT